MAILTESVDSVSEWHISFPTAGMLAGVDENADVIFPVIHQYATTPGICMCSITLLLPTHYVLITAMNVNGYSRATESCIQTNKTACDRICQLITYEYAIAHSEDKHISYQQSYMAVAFKLRATCRCSISRKTWRSNQKMGHRKQHI